MLQLTTIDTGVKTVNDLYKYLKTTDRFAGSHEAFTPQAVVEDILGAVPTANKKILVMFNLEFVVSLIYTCSIDPKTITFYSDHNNKTKMAQRLGVNCITGNVPMKKFDVVLLNPPYDLTNSKKLWPTFVNKALDIVANNGYVGCVCPSTWLTSNGSAFKKVRTRLTTDFDVQIVSRDAREHFDVGIDICYWTAKAAPYQNLTNYIENGLSTAVNVANGAPKSTNEQFIEAILQKIISAAPGFVWNINDRQNNTVKSSDISKTQTATHRYRVYQSTKNVGYIENPTDDYGKLKIAVNFSSSFYNAKDPNFNMPITTDCIGSLMAYYYVGDQKEGEQVRSLLTSKAVRFLVANYKKKNTGFSDAVKRGVIPHLPLKYWTDLEVYQACNLTQVEIDYIEDRTK